MELQDRRKFYFAIATLVTVAGLAVMDRLSGEQTMVCITALIGLFNIVNGVEWWAKNRPGVQAQNQSRDPQS